ncbi:MAG: hypothetical protein DI586_07110 [Micavibrio aeruginosavorus]|uniref:FAD-binding domain-containing protein n=1 Tax=Micavibrio aeruginosavorus TaxID=349221 RepID=A0A2W5FH93_9BACT|nr:MAG: hypothetical protein DI586_07110 [Micavibrio aeruginosavorus]
MIPLKIAVIGSGTAGLAASAFLMKDGHDVTLIERFSDPRPLGAGLMLQPTGLACLACLDLDQKAIAYGTKILSLFGRSANGCTVFDIDYRNLRPHFFGLGIHRGALFSILHEEVLRLKIRIITNCEITDTRIEGDKRVLINARGKDCGAYDLVVDASGTRSALRSKSPYIKLNKPYPYGAIWGVCEDANQAFGGNSLQQRYDGAGIMMGALAIGKRPSDQKETLAFFWSLPTHLHQAWKDDGMDKWKSQVNNYWPELAPFIDQFKTPDDLTFAQYSDVIMKRWDDERIVFIGDAAHSTSPQLGQGANLGMMDALILSLSLKQTDNLQLALSQYSKRRKSHTHFYQYASRWLTPFFQSDSKFAAFVRDRSFGLLCKTPYVKTEMMKTLAGIKTGLFTHMNPGTLHRSYDLRSNQPL